MEITQKKRSAVDTAYTWDLEAIYATLEDVDREMERAESAILAFSVYKGQLCASCDTLLEAFRAMDSIEQMLGKLRVYVTNRWNENQRNAKMMEYTEKLERLQTKAMEVFAFVEPEILAKEDGLYKKWLRERPELSEYRMKIEDILRYRPHVLSAQEEKLLSALQPVFRTGEKGFSMLTVADLRFPTVETTTGPVELSNGNFVPLLEREPRDVRKSIYHAFYDVYDAHKNALAASLEATVKSNALRAKIRHFASARESALFRNAVQPYIYDKLIETAHYALPLFHSYMRLRRDLLGLDDLGMMDIYTPLVAEKDLHYTFEEAKVCVLRALEPLGSAYVDAVREGYHARWCDVYETEGKRPGAYSNGSYGTYPYILLNFHGTLDDVFTLAHETGHSMHTYLSNRNQPYTTSRYSIFVAEVASTVNEVLLTYDLLERESDPAARRMMLYHFLETMRGTFFRQTMFAEFERDVYQRYETGGALSAEALSEMYASLNRKYYGAEVETDAHIAVEWARIPHFHYNFYVYQYATGISCALAFARDIREQKPDALQRYLEFLSGGSSLYPVDILKRAGVDISSSAPMERAMEIFGDFLERFRSESKGDFV